VAIVLTTQAAPLSLEQHADIASTTAEELDGELQPVMMAQAVPDPPPSNKKRVKVYELRNSDWFDRGTGFCNAEFTYVCIVSSLRLITCMSSCPS
jgi:hypothetical protein